MTTIEILSDLRCKYNCFDQGEEPVYRALSEAIKVLSEQPDVPDINVGDMVSISAVVDMAGKSEWFESSDAYNDFVWAINALPSAQPEIIRCKDCKHRPIKIYDGIVPPKEDDWKCPCLCDDYFYSWIPEDNFFCANGERKNDEC